MKADDPQMKEAQLWHVFNEHNEIELEFGDRCIITSKLIREREQTESFEFAEKRYWIREKLKTKEGIFLGVRRLTNGMAFEEDEVPFFVPQGSFTVALVALNAKDNPIYVPADSITEV